MPTNLPFTGLLATTQVTRADGPIGSEDLIALELLSLTVRPSNFLRAHSEGAASEGVVQLMVGEQITAVPFFGDGPVEPKYREKLLYVGRGAPQLPLGITVIESDEDLRKALHQGSRLFDWIGGIPLASATLAPAAALASGLLSYLRSGVRDLTEVAVRTRLDLPGHGAVLRLEIGGNSGRRLELELRILRLGQAVQPKKLVAVLQSLRLQIEPVRIAVPSIARGAPNKTPAHASVRLDVLDWFAREQIRELSFSAASSRRSVVQSLPFEPRGEALELRHWPLFEVGAVQESSGRLLAPFSIALSLDRFSRDLEKLSATLQAGLDLADAATDTAPFDLRAARAALKKQTPSILALLAELSPKSLSLVAFDGLLAVLPGGATVAAEAAAAGILLAQPVDGIPTAVLSRRVSLGRQELGSVEVTLQFPTVG